MGPSDPWRRLPALCPRASSLPSFFFSWCHFSRGAGWRENVISAAFEFPGAIHIRGESHRSAWAHVFSRRPGKPRSRLLREQTFSQAPHCQVDESNVAALTAHSAIINLAGPVAFGLRPVWGRVSCVNTSRARPCLPFGSCCLP